jgi:hypothetical protein
LSVDHIGSDSDGSLKYRYSCAHDDGNGEVKRAMWNLEPLDESPAARRRERLHSDPIKASVRLSCASASAPPNLGPLKALAQRSAHARA